MMSDEGSVEIFLRERQSLRPPNRDAGVLASRRQRMVRALRAHLVKSQERRQRFMIWRRVGVGVLAFGTAATALFAFTRSQSPSSSLAQQIGNQMGVSGAVGVDVGVIGGALLHRHGASQRNLETGSNIEVAWDDALETSLHDGAELRLSGLVNVTLSPQTEVGQMTARQGQVERISLTKGRAHLRVSKLKDGRRFHVITPFADVQVRGTAFDVEILPGIAPSTCVRVQEGLVEVTAAKTSHMVGAGQTWGCDPTVVPGVTSRVVPAPARVATLPPRARTAAENRVLRAQNQLFQQALHAQRAGSHDTAVEAYRVFLKRYPDAPLAAQARANLAAIPEAR